MKKIQAVLLAMLAICGLGAVLAGSASAETTLLAEWLVDGAAIAAGTHLETLSEGELLLEDIKAPIVGKAAALCSGLFEGTVGADGEDTITMIYDLTGRLIEELVGAGIKCVAETGCSESTEASPIEVWPVGLPLLSQLFLMEDGKILDLITSGSAAKLFGYELLCLIFGLNTEETCTQEDAEIEMVNDVNGDAEIPGGAKTLPLADCSQGGAATGENVADELSLITLLNGKLLSVSSE